MMHAFPALSISDVKSLEAIERRALLAHAIRIRARERLQSIFDFSVVFAKEDERRPYLAQLVDQAFADDEKTAVTLLEVISRKS